MQVSKINTTKYVDDKYQIKLELTQIDSRFSNLSFTIGYETFTLYSYYTANALRDILTQCLDDFNSR